MRMRVLREGTPTEDGRVITSNGTYWDEDVPLYSLHGMLVGRLTNLRREREGWITGEVQGVKISKGWALQAEIRAPLGTKMDDAGIAGKLVGAVIGDNPVWPGMRVS